MMTSPTALIPTLVLRGGGEPPDVGGADFSVLLPSENAAARARIKATSSTGTRAGRAGRGDRCRAAIALQRHFLVSTLLILRFGGVSSVPRGVLPHGSRDRTGTPEKCRCSIRACLTSFASGGRSASRRG